MSVLISPTELSRKHLHLRTALSKIATILEQRFYSTPGKATSEKTDV